ncbi:nuclear transport factor 2 family protein (plasmid) [Aminobacter sp. SR38]|uniref:nuclear transport factor 2 family protein n=1 Tax=Aminobacter sp. SR38 TaxID=2774562 RepID=UPI00177BE938|nr:nuclear transport factor 2 family protein [Aminobacter sp. SR38]QOF75491.1 nuclear transport factor 2 family protein [Aminobacter sp. SR38]
MKTYEERFAALEAVQAIRTLKHRYMLECDNGYKPEKLGLMFAQDAIWENSQVFGRHEGRHAIESFFARVSSQIVFAAHLALNDIIDVEGDTATGQWRMVMPCTIMEDGKSVSRWILGDYEEVYVRQNGVWLFQNVNFFMNFNTPVDESWVGTEMLRPR